MPKIILAEDDPMISEIYQRKFEEAGFDVAIADSGDLVVPLVKKGRPDIILLDLILPKMNGFDVIENVRKLDKNVSIIVFSNLSASEDREKAMKLGANGFVSKADYSPSDLVNEVRRLSNQLGEEKTNGEKDHNVNQPAEVSQGNAKRILMMEDEEIFREMFGEKLTGDGFIVDMAEDGAMGVKKAFAEKYDLFIIDMVMPNIAGDEIVTKLRREESTKNVPIIILSASVDEATQREMEEKNIQGFYIKTQLIPSELSKSVKELLDK